MVEIVDDGAKVLDKVGVNLKAGAGGRFYIKGAGSFAKNATVGVLMSSTRSLSAWEKGYSAASAVMSAEAFSGQVQAATDLRPLFLTSVTS